MPATVKAIVDTAEAEWTHWGKSTWNCITKKRHKGHVDDEETYAQYVIDTYCALFYKTPIKWPTTSMIGNDEYAWSAVTISYIMTKAGFTKDEFPISVNHSTYIRWAIKARKTNDKAAAYWGYRIDEPDAKPDVGDLIGYARGKKKITKAQALKFFDKTGSYESHSDIVVAKRTGEIDVIGGNVRDSVTKKTLALNGDGTLADTTSPWFVMMRKR